jgi:integrase
VSTFEQRPTGWTFRYRDSNGKHRRSSGHRTLRDAERERRRLLGDMDNGIILDRDKTFAWAAEQFLELHRAEASTVGRIRYALRPAIELFGATPMLDLKPIHILGIDRLGLSDQARWMTMRAIKQVCKFSVDVLEVIRKSPAASISNPQPGAEEIDPYEDWQEVLAIEEQLPEWCKGIAIFMVGTGMRPQEWPKLRPSHVDLDRRLLVLPRQIVKPKTPDRQVPLRKMVVDVLEHRLGVGGGLVWTSATGEAIDIRNFRNRVWYPAHDRAGVDRRKPYHARHTYATWALRAGLNTFMLAKRMGTSLEMIDRTYGKFAKDGAEHELFMLDAFDGLAQVPVGTDLGTPRPARVHTGSYTLLPGEAESTA